MPSDLSLLIIRLTNYQQLLPTQSTSSTVSSFRTLRTVSTLLGVDFRSHFSRLLLSRTAPAPLRSKRRILRFDNQSGSGRIPSRLPIFYVPFPVHIGVCVCNWVRSEITEISIGFSPIQQPNLITSNPGTGRVAIYRISTEALLTLIVHHRSSIELPSEYPDRNEVKRGRGATSQPARPPPGERMVYASLSSPQLALQAS